MFDRLFQKWRKPAPQSQPKAISIAEIKRLVGKEDPVILELGANDGADTERFLNAFPAAKVTVTEFYINDGLDGGAGLSLQVQK